MPEEVGTAIEKVAEPLYCKLMPNPVESFLTISAPQAHTIDVFSIMGERIMSITKTEEPYVIDVSSFNRGTYLFQLSSDTKRHTQMVVLK